MAGCFYAGSTYVPRSEIMFGTKEMAIPVRLFWAFWANLGYRCRLYFAWFLSESAYVSNAPPSLRLSLSPSLSLFR